MGGPGSGRRPGGKSGKIRSSSTKNKAKLNLYLAKKQYNTNASGENYKKLISARKNWAKVRG